MVNSINLLQLYAADVIERMAEIDILYAASNNLTQAGTPSAQLEAVSDYARSNGAVCGVLFYFEPTGTHFDEEVVAQWNNGTTFPLSIGTRFNTSDSDFAKYWLATPNRPTLVEDALEDERIGPRSRKIFERYQGRGAVIMPLHNKGRWIGMIMFLWATPHHFTERDARIYTALQQQAAPVVDSVRLYEQAQKRATDLEDAVHESRILYEASNRLAQANTPQEVLDAVSEYSHSRGASSGLLMYLEHNTIGRPVWQEVIAEWTAEGITPLGVGVQLPVAQHLTWVDEWPKLIGDTETAELPQIIRERFMGLGYRALALMPLTTHERLVGIIGFNWSTPQVFDERDRRIYTALQQGASSKIDSMRLLEQNRERAMRAERLLHINGSLLHAANEAEILSAVAEYAREQGARLLTLEYINADAAGSIIDAQAVALWQDGRVVSYNLPQAGARAQRASVLWQDAPEDVLFVEDIAGDPRLEPESRAELLATPNLHALAIIPLYNKRRSQGAITILWFAPHTFSDQEKYIFRALMQMVSAVVATRRAYLAMEQARYETERSARELAALEERTRLARELHDSVSQALYGIGLGARTARTLMTRDPSRLHEPLDYILSLTEAGLAEMRALIFELRPESLEQEGLVTALQKQAASLQARHNIRVETALCDEPQVALHKKESLYRIAREALHNTVKHAHATHVRLSMMCSDDGWRLEIEDNGLGFDPTGEFPGHLGLKSMRERTAALNGVFEIDSAPGDGTRITVTIYPEK